MLTYAQHTVMHVQLHRYTGSIICPLPEPQGSSTGSAYLKDISQGEDFGKCGSLAPGRHSINDVRSEGGRIVLYVHCHLAVHCHLHNFDNNSNTMLYRSGSHSPPSRPISHHAEHNIKFCKGKNGKGCGGRAHLGNPASSLSEGSVRPLHVLAHLLPSFGSLLPDSA